MNEPVTLFAVAFRRAHRTSPGLVRARLSWVLVFMMVSTAILVLPAPRARAQFAEEFELPIRWCAVAGSPAVTNPAAVGEADTDGVLWRRQERLSDGIYIPQTGVTWRSGIIAGVTGPANFPVIADQNTTVGNPGDVINPSVAAAEYNATVNACVAAWNALLPAGVGSDIGAVAINANRIVNAAGNPTTTLGTVAGAGFAARRVLLQDAAYSFAGSPLQIGSLGFDAAESTLGHELGHSLPTQLTPSTSTLGLRHACAASTFNTNMMSPTLGDLGVDGIWDQTLLGTSIGQAIGNGPDGNHCTADDVFETLNQITTIRQTAPLVPGCRLFGTSTACSTRSDTAADDVGDAEPAGLDVSLVSVTQPEDADAVDFSIETYLPIDRETFASGAQFLLAVDVDDNADTGLAPADLGVPIGFEGAELLLSGELAGQNEIVATAFIEDDNEWVQTERLKGFVLPNTTIVEVFEPAKHLDVRTVTSHSISWAVDRVLLDALGDTFRLAAVTRATNTADEPVLDGLGVDEGVDFGLGLAEFPTCAVTPNPAPAGGLAQATAQGLFPDRDVHALIGPQDSGQGRTNAAGNATVKLRVPADSPGRTRLVTVGVDDTALTADCPMEVDADATGNERHAGDNRVGTATAISERVLPSADTVVLARGDVFADALVGGPLAVHLDAPILLTGSSRLSEATAAEIRRLDASNAVLLGGTTALGPGVVDALEDLGLTVERVGGADRFDTARLVADELPDSSEVLVAEGRNPNPNRGWPDAVSASGLASPQALPVLLVTSDGVPAPTAAAIDEGDDVTIVGGPAAVSDATAAALDGLAGNVRRLSGADRYGTSAAVADEALTRGADPAVTWAATGRNWPDALVVSAAVGHENGVMTLVDGQNTAGSPATSGWIADHADDIRWLRLAGGPAAINADVEAALLALLGT